MLWNLFVKRIKLVRLSFISLVKRNHGTIIVPNRQFIFSKKFRKFTINMTSVVKQTMPCSAPIGKSLVLILLFPIQADEQPVQGEYKSVRCLKDV